MNYQPCVPIHWNGMVFWVPAQHSWVSVSGWEVRPNGLYVALAWNVWDGPGFPVCSYSLRGFFVPEEASGLPPAQPEVVGAARPPDVNVESVAPAPSVHLTLDWRPPHVLVSMAGPPSARPRVADGGRLSLEQVSQLAAVVAAYLPVCGTPQLQSPKQPE